MACVANWRYCRNCEVLAFAGGPALGACAAGGVHDHSHSGDYVLVEVPDCSMVPQEVSALEQKIASIENSPGYIQGPNNPSPGKPDPGMLAEVRKLQSGIAAASECPARQHDAMFDTVCDQTTCVSINAIYANIATQLNCLCPWQLLAACRN
jgi:hypothetical protein